MLGFIFTCFPLNRAPQTVVTEDILPEKEPTKRKYKKYDRKVPKRRHEIISFPIKAPYGSQVVPNGDIIHTYPKLLIDHLGGGDAEKFRYYMNSVCDPNIELVIEYSGEQNPFGPNNRLKH